MHGRAPVGAVAVAAAERGAAVGLATSTQPIRSQQKEGADGGGGAGGGGLGGGGDGGGGDGGGGTGGGGRLGGADGGGRSTM